MTTKKEHLCEFLAPNSHIFEHMLNFKKVLSRLRYTPSTEDRNIKGAIDDYIMKVNQLEEIKKEDLEVESEFEDTTYIDSWEDKINRANALMRFEMNGKSPQFYYYDNGKNRCSSNELYWVLFQQCLHDRGVNLKENENTDIVLRFLRYGAMSVRHG